MDKLCQSGKLNDIFRNEKANSKVEEAKKIFRCDDCRVLQWLITYLEPHKTASLKTFWGSWQWKIFWRKLSRTSTIKLNEDATPLPNKKKRYTVQFYEYNNIVVKHGFMFLFAVYILTSLCILKSSIYFKWSVLLICIDIFDTVDS